MRSVPISTMKKSSHGRDVIRCSASANRRWVIVSMSARRRSLSSVRKFSTSTMYSPTTSSISRAGSLGYVYSELVNVGCEEAGHHHAVHAAGRVGPGHAEDHHGAIVRGRDVPHARDAHGARISEAEVVVGVVAAIAEPVDPQRAGIARRGHDRPGGHGDRRVARAQDTAASALDESAQRREVVEPAIEDELRGGAIEADDEDAAHRPAVTPIAAWHAAITRSRSPAVRSGNIGSESSSAAHVSVSGTGSGMSTRPASALWACTAGE